MNTSDIIKFILNLYMNDVRTRSKNSINNFFLNDEQRAGMELIELEKEWIF